MGKKKEKYPKLPTVDPVVADLSLPDITLKGKSETSVETSVDVPPPKPPRLDTNLDSNASLLVSGTDIGVDTPSTIISGSEISVSLTDGKVVPNIGSETQIDLPSLSLEKDTDRSLVPKMGLSAKLSKADVEGQGPKTDDHLEIPSVDTSSESRELEKKSSFSFGFGSKRDKKKKEKKEKEPSSPSATSDVNIQLGIDVSKPDINTPSADLSSPSLDAKADSSLPSAEVHLPKTSGDFQGPKIDVDMNDTDIDVKLPELGFSGPKLAGDEQGPKTDVHLEVPSVDTPSESHELEKKSSFSFGFGSKRDKKKKDKKEKEPSSLDSNVNIDATLPDVDGNGLMKNWYKEKSPTKEKRKSGGLSLGFGGKNKEIPDAEVKQPDLEVPQEVNIKKKGSFLGGLMKKGSKAKDVEDVSLKYKGKLKDNIDEDINVKANLEGDAKGVAMDVDLPSVTLKGPEISNGGTTRGFKLFNDAPDHKDGTTGIAVNGKAPTATLDTGASGGEMEIELPSVGLKVDVPKVDLSLPKTKGEAEVAITVPDPNLPALEIEKTDTNLPEVE